MCVHGPVCHKIKSFIYVTKQIGHTKKYQGPSNIASLKNYQLYCSLFHGCGLLAYTGNCACHDQLCMWYIVRSIEDCRRMQHHAKKQWVQLDTGKVLGDIQCHVRSEAEEAWLCRYSNRRGHVREPVVERNLRNRTHISRALVQYRASECANSESSRVSSESNRS